MSGVDRYEVTEGGGLFKCDGGDMVFFEDYDQLHAANQRLQSELAELKAEEPEWSAQMQRLGDANQRLEAAKGDPVGSFDKHMEYMQRCAELTADNQRLEGENKKMRDALEFIARMHIIPPYMTPQASQLILMKGHADAALSTANGEVTE